MKKYKCMNIPNCDFANKGEIFEIAEGESPICPKCKNGMVVEVKPGINWKIVGRIIAAIALIGGGLGAYFGLKGDKLKKGSGPGIEVVDSDSIAHVQDSLRVLKDSLEKQREDSLRVLKDSLEKQREDSLRVLKDSLEKLLNKPAPPTTSPGTPRPPAQPRTINLGYGTYTGDIKNGKPHGHGTIIYRSSHAITSSIMASPGDKYEGDFRDGRVSGGIGYWTHNGNMKTINP